MSPEPRTALIWAVKNPDAREADILLVTSTGFLARYWYKLWWGVQAETNWIDRRIRAIVTDSDRLERIMVAGPTSYILPTIPEGTSEWEREYLAAVVREGLEELWFCVNNQLDLEAASLVRIRVALRYARQTLDNEGIRKGTTRPPGESYKLSPWYPAP